jgi:hypothetical protein
VLAIAVLVIWRITSVTRGTRQRDEKISTVLEPLPEKLAKKEHLSSDSIIELACQPHVRPMLYALLKHFERLDLFPSQYLDK